MASTDSESKLGCDYEVKIYRTLRKVFSVTVSHDVSALIKLDRGYIKLEEGSLEDYVGEDLLIYLQRLDDAKEKYSFKQVVQLCKK